MKTYHKVYLSLCQFLAISGRSQTQRKVTPREKFLIYGTWSSMYEYLMSQTNHWGTTFYKRYFKSKTHTRREYLSTVQRKLGTNFVPTSMATAISKGRLYHISRFFLYFTTQTERLATKLCNFMIRNDIQLSLLIRSSIVLSLHT